MDFERRLKAVEEELRKRVRPRLASQSGRTSFATLASHNSDQVDGTMSPMCRFEGNLFPDENPDDIGNMRIRIEGFEETFSRYFATDQQKEDLKRIANEYDTDDDQELDYTEYENMKKHLKENENSLYRVVLKTPLAS